MRRRALLLGLAVVVLPATVFAQAAQTPEAAIRALYAAHLSGNPVHTTPELRRRFFTPDLIRAIRRGEQRAARHPGIVGTLDFDPLTDSQHPVERNVEIRQLSADGEDATVLVSFNKGPNERVELHFSLVRINGAWRVDDIRREASAADPGWSVRQTLRMR